MPKTDELVTVYMPTHNRPELALRAIRSVLNQTYSNIELIVCDDGSDWDSYTEVRRVLKKNNYLYLRNNNPKGACVSRNNAISSATGTLVTGIDDDDEFTTEHISSLVSNFSESLSFIATTCVEVTSHGIKNTRYDVGIITLEMILHYNRIGNQMLTKTTRLRKVGMYDPAFPAMQDYDTWIRLIRDYGPAKKIQANSYILHTTHDQHRISTNNTHVLNGLKKFREKYADLFNNQHLHSHFVLEKKLKNERMHLSELLRWTNKDNYRLALLTFLQSTRSLLKNIGHNGE